jgi:hypothetical protein
MKNIKIVQYSLLLIWENAIDLWLKFLHSICVNSYKNKQKNNKITYENQFFFSESKENTENGPTIQKISNDKLKQNTILIKWQKAKILAWDLFLRMIFNVEHIFYSIPVDFNNTGMALLLCFLLSVVLLLGLLVSYA